MTESPKLRGQEATHPSLGVREVTVDDVDALREILRTAVVHPFSQEAYENEIEDVLRNVQDSLEGNRYQYYVATSEGKVLGMMGLRAVEEDMRPHATRDNACELINAYVHKDARGTGAGRLLVDTIVQRARELGFDELVLNSGPRYMLTGWPFWNRVFGQPNTQLRGFYGQGWHAMFWSKLLTDMGDDSPAPPLN